MYCHQLCDRCHSCVPRMPNHVNILDFVRCSGHLQLRLIMFFVSIHIIGDTWNVPRWDGLSHFDYCIDPCVIRWYSLKPRSQRRSMRLTGLCSELYSLRSCTVILGHGQSTPSMLCHEGGVKYLTRYTSLPARFVYFTCSKSIHLSCFGSKLESVTNQNRVCWVGKTT